MNEPSEIIQEALKIENEKERRLKKLDEFMATFDFLIQTAGDMLHVITEEYYNKYHPKPVETRWQIGKQEVLNDPAIKYLLEAGHVLPDGMKKHSVLFKNLAILFHNAGFTEGEIRELAKKICLNCPGHHAGEIIAWLKHIRASGRAWEFNRREFESCLEEGRKHG